MTVPVIVSAMRPAALIVLMSLAVSTALDRFGRGAGGGCGGGNS